MGASDRPRGTTVIVKGTDRSKIEANAFASSMQELNQKKQEFITGEKTRWENVLANMREHKDTLLSTYRAELVSPLEMMRFCVKAKEDFKTELWNHQRRLKEGSKTLGISDSEVTAIYSCETGMKEAYTTFTDLFRTSETRFYEQKEKRACQRIWTFPMVMGCAVVTAAVTVLPSIPTVIGAPLMLASLAVSFAVIAWSEIGRYVDAKEKEEVRNMPFRSD